MATTTGTLLAYVETKTQAGTGTLNNTTVGIPFLNEALLDFRSEMIKRGVDASQTQEAYIPTVTVPAAGQGSTFSYPSDMYFLKTVEVNFTDTTQQNYIQAKQIDVANTPDQASFDYIRKNQLTTMPLIDDRGDTFEIFPTFTSGMNLTNAIKIIYFLTPTPYVTTGDNLTYPDSLNWYLLAKKVAAIYYQSLNKFNEAAAWEAEYKKGLDTLDTTLSEGMQQPIEPIPLMMTGWNF